MPIHSSYIVEELRLDLSFSGNLDVSVAQEICDICRSLQSDLRSCIVDLSSVERLFDSGVALLKMLYRSLVKKGILVVILSDSPKIRERMRATASGSLPFFFLQGPGTSADSFVRRADAAGLLRISHRL